MIPGSIRVYVYCRPEAPAYQDDVVVLAEGLRALGIPAYGNCNYWRRSVDAGDWLVRHDPAVGPKDCDLVVVSYAWVRWLDSDFKAHTTPLPEDLFAPGRKYRTAYIDLDDGYETPSWTAPFRAFDVVFRAKYNGRCFHPENHRPWVLGFTSRVTQALGELVPWRQRNREILINFYASHSYVHGARALMERRFTPRVARAFTINRTRDDLSRPPDHPHDRLMWEQTQRRHSPSYYRRLAESQAVAAFCGELIPSRPFRPDFLVGGRKARLRRAYHELLARFSAAPPRLIQWDSWRFWEALVAGCVVFNFDLPVFGVKLPVMPENLVHYVGVRPDNVEEVLAELEQRPTLLPAIAEQGRAWALKHYSPEALARRLLDTVAVA